MKFRSVIVSILICLNQTGPTLAQAHKPLGELTIRVKSSEGPFEGASVVVTSGSAVQRINSTNAEGVSEFRELQAGSYSVQVVQRGFFLADAPDKMSLEVQNGQSQSVSIYLVKGGVLKGRVVSIDGSPIVGMAISALKVASKRSSLPSTKESNVTAVSDDRGEFRLYGLRPGSYTVAVNVERNASSLKSFGTLFYPGERQIANATTFDLVAGQEVAIPDLVIDLNRVNQNSLSGMVRGAHGKPLKGVSLSLLSDGFQLSDSSISDNQGYFNFEGLPAGDYVLKASFTGHGYFNLQRQIVIKDFVANNVTLELRSYPVISGRAYLRDRTGVSPLSWFPLQLEPAQNGNENIEFVTDKEGNFSQRSSKDGMFWWSFPKLQPNYFINRILVDGKDVTNRPVILDQATDLGGITVEMSAGAAEIRGVIHEGSCQQNLVYAVALDPKRDEIQFVRKAICSADAFRIQSLPPYRYYVIRMSAEDSMSPCKREACTKQQGIDDKHYAAIERVFTTLRTTGTKALTLNADQIMDNVQPILVDPKIGLPMK